MDRETNMYGGNKQETFFPKDYYVRCVTTKSVFVSRPFWNSAPPVQRMRRPDGC